MKRPRFGIKTMLLALAGVSLPLGMLTHLWRASCLQNSAINDFENFGGRALKEPPHDVVGGLLGEPFSVERIRLELGTSRVDGEVESMLAKAEAIGNVTMIVVKCHDVPPHCLGRLSDFRCIEEIQFRDAREYTDENWRSILGALHNCDTLLFSDALISEHLIECLAQMPKLKTVWFSSSSIQCDPECFASLSHIPPLHFESCLIAARDWEVISECIPESVSRGGFDVTR